MIGKFTLILKSTELIRIIKNVILKCDIITKVSKGARPDGAAFVARHECDVTNSFSSAFLSRRSTSKESHAACDRLCCVCVDVFSAKPRSISTYFLSN